MALPPLLPNRYVLPAAQNAPSKPLEIQKTSKHGAPWSDFKAKRLFSVHTHKRMIFDSGRPLKFTESAGALIDFLIGICFARSAYLRSIDARRHIVLLNELKQFSCERNRWDAKPKECKVGDLPLREISPAVEQWILSFFAEGCHPLMPSFALDTAQFIESHVEGHYGHDPEPWEIKPIVDSPKDERNFFQFLDARFKRDFTQSMGTLRLCATVPENCKIVKWSGEVVLKSGDELLFNTERCHLSSGFYDRTNLKCVESTNVQFDLHREFRFMGAAFVIPKSSPPLFVTKKDLFDSASLDFIGINIELPAYWIDGVVELHENDRASKPKVLDLPRWEAEVD